MAVRHRRRVAKVALRRHEGQAGALAGCDHFIGQGVDIIP